MPPEIPLGLDGEHMLPRARRRHLQQVPKLLESRRYPLASDVFSTVRSTFACRAVNLLTEASRWASKVG